MREIKFRGKRVDCDKWVYGDLAQLYSGRKYIINNRFGACIDAHGNFINTEAPFVVQVDTDTIGQYTGLKDKNGVEIYEGDVLKFDVWKPKEVVYGDDNCKCVGFSLKGTMKALYTYDSDMCEVVGNVHEVKA